MYTRTVSVVLALIASAGSASAQVSATLVIAQNQVLPGTGGLTCGTLNDPYTNGLGKVGFTGNSSGGNFVWYDTGVVWLNTSATTHTLTGAEGTMGISNSGGFLYSPTANPGGDSAWTQAGMLLNEGDPLPHIPGKFSSYNSRPRMTDDGAAVWAIGIRDTATGTTSNRGFFRVADPTNPVFETLILGGNTYAGLTATTGATNFGFDVSGNGQYRIHSLTVTGATANDLCIYLSNTDSLAAREGFGVAGSATELWTAFRIPGINNFGNWVVAGDTNAATTMDEVVVYNNTVLAREGQVFGANTMAGIVDALSINNRDRVAFIYSGSTGNPSTLIAGPAANFATGAHALLSVGGTIDVDGDNAADYTIADFEASNTIAPGLDLGDNGMVYVQVSITPIAGGTTVEAIIGVRDICIADFNGDNVVDFFDYLDFVDAFSNGSTSADFNLDGVIDFFDYLDFVDAFSSGC